jgi:4'-phosphopantetheinyl transferase EntD
MSTMKWSSDDLPMAFACAAGRPGRIVAINWHGLYNAFPLTIFFTVYDAAQFDGLCFREAGIDCPVSIARAVTKRQAEYFYGRLCARAALAHNDAGLHQIPVGKMREPVWPANYAGSITHSRALAAAVAVPAEHCSGIGIDVEEAIDDAALHALCTTVVTETELAYLNSIAAEIDIRMLLTLIFSAKESFFKAVFSEIQRYIDFQALELRSIDIGTRRIMFAVTETLGGRFQMGDICEVGFELIGTEYVFTVCAW